MVLQERQMQREMDRLQRTERQTTQHRRGNYEWERNAEQTSSYSLCKMQLKVEINLKKKSFSVTPQHFSSLRSGQIFWQNHHRVSILYGTGSPRTHKKGSHLFAATYRQKTSRSPGAQGTHLKMSCNQRRHISHCTAHGRDFPLHFSPAARPSTLGACPAVLLLSLTSLSTDKTTLQLYLPYNDTAAAKTQQQNWSLNTASWERNTGEYFCSKFPTLQLSFSHE